MKDILFAAVEKKPVKGYSLRKPLPFKMTNTLFFYSVLRRKGTRKTVFHFCLTVSILQWYIPVLPGCCLRSTSGLIQKTVSSTIKWILILRVFFIILLEYPLSLIMKNVKVLFRLFSSLHFIRTSLINEECGLRVDNIRIVCTFYFLRFQQKQIIDRRI